MRVDYSRRVKAALMIPVIIRMVVKTVERRG